MTASPATATVWDADRPPRPGGPGTRPAGLRGSRRLLLGAVLPVALVVAWQLLTDAGAFTPVQLPGPVAVMDAGVDLAERGLLQQYAAVSTQRVVLGFGIGAAAGLLIGSLVGLSRLADVLLGPLVGALRAVPSLAWVPLLLLWLGIYEPPKVTLIAIGAFFPVYTTTATALRHVDASLVEAGRAFGLRGVRLLGVVQLPAATPGVLAGLRLGLAQGWLFLVAAELIAASQGLGFLLTDSSNNGRTDRILLAILALAVLGKLTDALVGVGERVALARWT